MKFMDVVLPGLILCDMRAETKEEAFREFADALSREDIIDDHEDFFKAILKREELGSTGGGRGFAVPHTKLPAIDRCRLAFGISKVGIDWASLDGELVYIIFLILSPTDRPCDHLRTLEMISRAMRSDTLRRFLKQAESFDDIWMLLEECDDGQFND